VLEQEPELATHQSGHNSGVIHAGLYYPPGSLKARLCREGKAELEAYCQAKGIPFQRVGKLVVALDGEDARLAALAERATANGVEGLEHVGPERIREIEPHVVGRRGLWSPGTGIVDYRQVTLAYADDVQAAGGTIWTGRRVTGITTRGDEVILSTSAGGVIAGRVIACAGLWSDQVARLSGDLGRRSPRIVPFRGDY
jgi:L-2-hydroxyglutarate oxidase LhgO